MAIDPFIPLFRLYRDSLLESVKHPCPRSGVLDDYYFRMRSHDLRCHPVCRCRHSLRHGRLACVEGSLAARIAGLHEPCGALDILPAPTFKQVFRNAVELVWRATGLDRLCCRIQRQLDRRVLPAGAALPGSEILLHLRDPRAVIHSSEYAADFNKRPPITSLPEGCANIWRWVGCSAATPN